LHGKMTVASANQQAALAASPADKTAQADR
jgi:hypothetical protein